MSFGRHISASSFERHLGRLQQRVEYCFAFVEISRSIRTVEDMTTGPDDEQRWLTDDEQRTWQAYLQATALLEDHLDRRLQRDAGMPHIYYGLLVWLERAPRRRMRMTELAQNAKITRSRLSHAVARLEKNGWVRRENCPSDKRGQFAVLTDEGYDVLEKSAPGHVAAVRGAIFDRLTQEQVEHLGEICRTISEGLQPDRGADLPWLR
jgi:DNA-binding MarR family transcriptional regulator